jgi:hypothetical protein
MFEIDLGVFVFCNLIDWYFFHHVGFKKGREAGLMLEGKEVPCLKISPGDLDLWPWKSTGFQILLRTKHVPSLVKIHWRMVILECSQGCYAVKIWPGDLDLRLWKSIGFHIILRTKYLPSLVKIHWRMVILECSQGCYGRTDGSVTISLRNFVGEGINIYTQYLMKSGVSKFFITGGTS